MARTNSNLSNLVYNGTTSSSGVLTAGYVYTITGTSAGESNNVVIGIKLTTQNDTTFENNLALNANDGQLVYSQTSISSQEDAQAHTSVMRNAAFTPSTATAAIPEPATTTLSLLALAGLCARRRRN